MLIISVAAAPELVHETNNATKSMYLQNNGPRETIVAPDGSGNFKTVQEAIAAAPTGTPEHPSVIHVKPGNYRELLYVQREKRFLRIIGDDPATTVVTFALSSGLTGLDGKPIGTFRTPTATFDADDLTIEGISLINSAGAKGPALAARVDGDRITFRNCRFSGWQDTLFDNRGRHYYQNCTITGATDFIFGGGTSYFEGCHIICTGNGYVTAASTPDYIPYGYIFSNCTVTGATPEIKTYLGRPWRDYAHTVFLNCDLGNVVRPEGWSNWNNREKTVRYAEYRCFGPGADTKARVPWAKKLSGAEGDPLTLPERVLAGPDGWNPRAGYAFGGTVATNVAYSDKEQCRLDISSPEGTGPFPMVIMVHGGGWASGDKEGDFAPLLGPLLSRKFVWLTINYRLSAQGQWPACQEDVSTAIRWAKANAARFKGDPTRIAIIGYSAGGQLATRAAVDTTADIRVQAAVGFAAPTDIAADVKRRGGELSTSLMPLFGHTAPAVDNDAREKMKQMSAIEHIPANASTSLPPFLLVHGTADKSVPYDQSIAFQAKLKAAGVSCDLITLPEAPHAIAQWRHIDPDYLEKVAAWLEKTLKTN